MSVLSVSEGIETLNTLYNTRKDPGEIRTLAMFWFDMFRGVSRPDFEEAIRDIVASEKFFPVPATVRNYIDDVQRRKALTGGSPKLIEDDKVASREWVRELRIRKGQIDPDGNPINRGPKIDEKYRPGQKDDLTSTREIIDHLFSDGDLKLRG